MCNGEHGRPAEGGTIAILRPISPPSSVSASASPQSPKSRPPLQRNLSLRFSANRFLSEGPTTAMIDGLADDGLDAGGEGEGRWVVIHRDGDLSSRQKRKTLSRSPSSLSSSSTSSFSEEEDEGETTDWEEVFDPSTILHMIPLPLSAQLNVPFDLGRKLDLGVGGEGVIGRRVSLVSQGRVLGEGIMGWN